MTSPDTRCCCDFYHLREKALCMCPVHCLGNSSPTTKESNFRESEIAKHLFEKPQPAPWEQDIRDLLRHLAVHGYADAIILRMKAEIEAARKEDRETSDAFLEQIADEFSGLNLDYWQHGAEKKCEYQEALKEIDSRLKKHAARKLP